MEVLTRFHPCVRLWPWVSFSQTRSTTLTEPQPLIQPQGKSNILKFAIITQVDLLNEILNTRDQLTAFSITVLVLVFFF